MSERLRRSMRISAKDAAASSRILLIDVVLRKRAVRQSRQRVVIGELRNARLAHRDALLHGIEGRGELAEIFGAARHDRPAVAAFLDAPRRLHEFGDRTRGAVARQHADAARRGAVRRCRSGAWHRAGRDTARALRASAGAPRRRPNPGLSARRRVTVRYSSWPRRSGQALAAVTRDTVQRHERLARIRRSRWMPRRSRPSHRGSRS